MGSAPRIRSRTHRTFFIFSRSIFVGAFYFDRFANGQLSVSLPLRMLIDMSP